MEAIYIADLIKFFSMHAKERLDARSESPVDIKSVIETYGKNPAVLMEILRATFGHDLHGKATEEQLRKDQEANLRGTAGANQAKVAHGATTLMKTQDVGMYKLNTQVEQEGPMKGLWVWAIRSEDGPNVPTGPGVLTLSR